MLPSAVMTLLPTPGANDATGPEPQDQRKDRGAGGPALRDLPALLPTPAVNDMGAGKTPEQWDEWTAKMRAKHGNGNGHGASLHIEAARIGASTPPQSPAGPESSDDPHQPPLS
jgi:DNA (cytosine-5)-methyltransferase 1